MANMKTMFDLNKIDSQGISMNDNANMQIAKEAKNALEVRNLNFFYGSFQGLKDINLDIEEGKVTAFIGPSGCGKSTLLRSINRMNDLIDSFRANGNLFIDDVNVYDSAIDVVSLRKQVGMVFQKSIPFPKSIYENVAYGLRLTDTPSKSELDGIIETSSN